MSLVKHVLISVFMLFPMLTVANVRDEGINAWNNSDVFVMYYPDNIEQFDAYNIDHISWGPQYSKIVNSNLNDINSNLYSTSIDLPLIQEGSKYVLCGSYSLECDKKFWEVRRSDYDISLRKHMAIKGVYDRSLKDRYGMLASVPWLKNRNIFSPLPSVSDEQYLKWLSLKIDDILELRPDSVHIDEAFTELSLLREKKYYGNNLALKKYEAYENAPYNVSQWAEYKSTKIRDATKFFTRLTEYIRVKADYGVLISANVNLLDSSIHGFIKSIDYVASEIKHIDARSHVSIIPMLNYKVADIFGVKVVSTAQGTDWLYVKNNGHENLVVMWIAHAYASGHYMNFPLKTWVPGSSYEPDSEVFTRLSRWVKDVSKLFDGFKAYNQYTINVNSDDFERYDKKRHLINRVQGLIDKGITFDFVINDNTKNYNIDSMVGNIEVNADKVYALPRVKKIDRKLSMAIHLLNRDYDIKKRSSVRKVNFGVSISRNIFDSRELKAVILHRPDLMSDHDAVGVELKYSINDGFVEIEIPSLDYWGILEIKFNDV